MDFVTTLSLLNTIEPYLIVKFYITDGTFIHYWKTKPTWVCVLRNSLKTLKIFRHLKSWLLRCFTANKNATLTSNRMTKLLWTCPKLVLGSTTRSSILKPFHTILINTASAHFTSVLPKYKFNISMTKESNQNQTKGIIFNWEIKNLANRKYIFEDSLREAKNNF